MNQTYQRISELLRPGGLIILPPIFLNEEGNDTIEGLFDDQREVVKPLDSSFKEGLEHHTVNEEDIDVGLSCAICLDNFKLDNIVIKLPCNGDISHFFHSGDGDGPDLLCLPLPGPNPGRFEISGFKWDLGRNPLGLCIRFGALGLYEFSDHAGFRPS